MADTVHPQETEHRIERPGCTIHYWLAGPEDRPLVVLMHGATMDHRMFDPQIAALVPQYRTLRWDARGHGRSRPAPEFTLEDCAADLIAILDAIGVDQVVLVGQSMGGYIAQYVYLRQPERVRAIVIIGATSIALPYALWEIWALQATLPMFRLWPYNHLAGVVARSTALRPEVQAYALEVVRQFDRREFLTIWKAVTQAVRREGLPDHRIDVPLLLTHGDQDNTGSVKRQAPAWAASEPNVELVVIPNASHNANQDNPTFFNDLLLRFLAHVDPRHDAQETSP